MSGSRPDRVDVFVSYTGADRVWAEWIGLQLEEAGYSVFLQAWDIQPGNDWVPEMHSGVERAERMLPVLSEAYLRSSEFGEAEWRPFFAEDPSGEGRRLIPVRVEPCDPPGLLRTRVYADLVGLSEREAKEELLRGLRERGARPDRTPSFPGRREALETERPSFPGALPRTFTVPFSPNPLFAGRDEDLRRIERGFAADGPRQLMVLTGIGGVGKTQLAAQYAYGHQEHYDVVWWVQAQEPATLLADFAAWCMIPTSRTRSTCPPRAGSTTARTLRGRGWSHTSAGCRSSTTWTTPPTSGR